jgi:hypothetical protein
MDISALSIESSKKEIYKDMADIMLASLENGSMSAEDSEEASTFMLDRLDSVSDEFYLYSLLEELVSRWPIFSPLLQPRREEQAKIADAQNIANISSELKNLNQ